MQVGVPVPVSGEIPTLFGRVTLGAVGNCRIRWVHRVSISDGRWCLVWLRETSWCCMVVRMNALLGGGGGG